MPRPQLPAMPQRLAPVAGIGTNAMPAIDHAGEARTRRIALAVRGADVAALGDRAGVSIFDSRTSGNFRWLPLTAFQTGADGALTLATTTTSTAATVTLAREEGSARHGYLVGRQIEFEASDAGPITVELEASVHAVELRVPNGIDRAGPLQLRRVGDPLWLPLTTGGAGLVVERSGTRLQLGAGTYELQLPLDPDTTQRFTLPGSPTVVLTTRLAPATAGRR